MAQITAYGPEGYFATRMFVLMYVVVLYVVTIVKIKRENATESNY